MKIGMLTSGGDCQGLNSALRGVAKSLYFRFGKDVEIYGIRDGYRGLIEGDLKKMSPSDFSGILTLGGTILGTSRQSFKTMCTPMEEYNGKTKLDKMLETYKKYKLDALVILGGNGTHKTANLLAQNGVNVVSLPKTIDNDLWGTDMTFGFQSAVDIATNVIDCIHSTASSHGRVFIVEVMGHKVGWLTLYAGISGGADVILIPEIPYDVDKVCDVLKARKKNGKPFSILAVAEGALSKEEAKLSKKEFKAARASMKEPSISYRLANEIAERTGQEIRVTLPGHFQRGGSPCAYDRMLTTRFGTAAADLIANKQFGYMVALRDNKVVPVPLSEVAGKLKTVSPDCEEVLSAKAMGISMGV
ncbi:6-phosphofructokinase [Negativibacillus massiliensis]|uniref:6-phosphofructokinase n=1 Tax=Negativibacillus massiliensis TaxID=1871035 RepID=UPI003AF4B15A